MLRSNRRSVVQQALGAQGIGETKGAQEIGGAGGVGNSIFRLIEEELARLESLEDEMTEIGKEAIVFTAEVGDTINATKNSIGLTVAAFVVANLAFHYYYMTSPAMSWIFWSFVVMWSLIASMMAMGDLVIVRRKFGALYRRHCNMVLRSTHFHLTLEADAARGGLDRDLRIRLASLREESFARPGKQILLHLFIVVLCIMGISGSGTLIGANYKIAKHAHARIISKPPMKAPGRIE